MSFTLDPRLEAESIPLKELPLSKALLRDDARFPWVVLVPRRWGLTEIHELARDEREILMEEIAKVSAALRALPGAEKINVGALGNLVPQLHVHVVARHAGDAAWPGPVWGVGEREPYAPDALADLAAALRDVLLGS